MSNTITIELCKEDRERLDLLSSAIIALGGELKNFFGSDEVAYATGGVLANELAEPQEVPKAEPPEITHPAEEVTAQPDPEPAVAPEPELPKYTKENILAKVQSLAGPNNPKRDAAKAIVKKYGAKVSDIPEDKYTEVMAQLIALEG